MISNFSDAGYLIPRLPHPRSCFFEQTVPQSKFGDQLLQIAHLLAQAFNLARGRLAPNVASEALLARFEKFLRPAVIQTLGDAFMATQGGDAVLAAQARYHDPDLLLSLILLARLAAISRTALSAGSLLLIDFCLIFVPFGHYDEPEILRYAITSICPKGADVRQNAPNGPCMK